MRVKLLLQLLIRTSSKILVLMITMRVSSLSMQSEEFDTRVMLHAANAASQGYRRTLIIANDTDVICPGDFSSLILMQRNCGCHLEWARS